MKTSFYKLFITIRLVGLFVFLTFSSMLISCNAQIAEKSEDISPLLIGETLPNENIVNSNNIEVELLSLLKLKPSVIVFYRGGWCPYCNLQLAALAQAENEILKLGYQIIAISPEDFKNITSTTSTDSVKYQVFSDPGGNLIQKVGIAFKTPLLTKGYISTKTKGDVSQLLPVPTVMVANTDGEILFEYINPNYKKRITKQLLLAVLSNL